MFDSTMPAHALARLRPIAAALAAMACLTASAASVAATTWIVDTCDEANAGSGTTGSLRYAAANAVSGDTMPAASPTKVPLVWVPWKTLGLPPGQVLVLS